MSPADSSMVFLSQTHPMPYVGDVLIPFSVHEQVTDTQRSPKHRKMPVFTRVLPPSRFHPPHLQVRSGLKSAALAELVGPLGAPLTTEEGRGSGRPAVTGGRGRWLRPWALMICLYGCATSQEDLHVQGNLVWLMQLVHSPEERLIGSYIIMVHSMNLQRRHTIWHPRARCCFATFVLLGLCLHCVLTLNAHGCLTATSRCELRPNLQEPLRSRSPTRTQGRPVVASCALTFLQALQQLQRAAEYINLLPYYVNLRGVHMSSPYTCILWVLSFKGPNL